MAYRVKTVNELLGGQNDSLLTQIYKGVSIYGNIMQTMENRDYRRMMQHNTAVTTVNNRYKTFSDTILKTKNIEDQMSLYQNFLEMDNKNTLKTDESQIIKDATTKIVQRRNSDYQGLIAMSDELAQHEIGGAKYDFDTLDFYKATNEKGINSTEYSDNHRLFIDLEKQDLEKKLMWIAESAMNGTTAGNTIVKDINDKIAKLDALEGATGEDDVINRKADINLAKGLIDGSIKGPGDYYHKGKADQWKNVDARNKAVDTMLRVQKQIANIKTLWGEDQSQWEQEKVAELSALELDLKKIQDEIKVLDRNIETINVRHGVSTKKMQGPDGKPMQIVMDEKRADWANIGPDKYSPEAGNTEITQEYKETIDYLMDEMGKSQDEAEQLASNPADAARIIQEHKNNLEVQRNLEKGSTNTSVEGNDPTDANPPLNKNVDKKDKDGKSGLAQMKESGKKTSLDTKKSQLLKKHKLIWRDGNFYKSDAPDETADFTTIEKYNKDLKKIEKTDKDAIKADSSNEGNSKQSRTQWFQRNKKAIRTAFGGDNIEQGLMQKLATRFREEGLLGLGDNGEAMDLNKAYDHK